MTYTDPNGKSQAWTLDNEAIDVNTAALCPTGVIKCFGGGGAAQIVPQYLYLPTGAYYTFAYNDDSSGELQQIVLPTGGSISYTYSGYRCIANPLVPQGQDCRMAVASRSVTQGGSSATWKYNNLGVVTDPYGNDEVHTFSLINDPACYSAGTYETQVQYWSGSSASGAGGTVLKTVSTSYTGDDVGTISGAGSPLCLYNVRPISQNTTINGYTRGTQTDYETFVAAGGYNATRMNITAFREYDYASGSSPGTLLRQAKNTFGLNSNSAYINLNIVDRVTQKTVYDGSGNEVAQTTYEYDNYGHANQPMVASGAVQHDSNFGTSYTTRGNVTAISQWRNTDGALLTTTKQFDDAGNVLSSIDPLSNMTSFSFTDSWSNSTCAPSGQGKAYVTTITNALKQATTKTYDSCTGAVASTTDANSQPTTYSYDMMGRTTQISYPDGGSTGYCYTDLGGTACTKAGPPYQTVATKAITSSPALNEVSTVLYDGLGRLSQTQLNSDVPTTTYTLTTYDALGRKYQSYNPTRCNPITTNCGETTWGYSTFNYDPLSRVTSVLEQDGSTVSTSYAAFPCTTVTDEAGNARESCADGLGRMTSVLEDPGSSPHLNYKTIYTYDGLSDLVNVTQNGSNSGGARTRTFTYDSLSHLVCAANPEIQSVTCPASSTSAFPAGAVTYKYDNDGNLTSKTSPAPNQLSASTTVTVNQSYDALNRLTKKTYTGMTMPTLQYGYDGVALSACTTTPPSLTDSYPVARRTSMCDGSGATSWAHDKMGRVKQEERTVGAATGKSLDYAYNLDGSLSSLETPALKTIAYTYNGAARAISGVDTSDSINFVTAATYAPPGELTGMTMGSTTSFTGITTANAYSDRLQPILLSATSPTATVFSECFDFHLGVAVNTSPCSFKAVTSGDNGNVYQIVNNRYPTTRNDSFTYDSLNRINSGQSNGTQWGETFTIDAWGNLTNRAGVTGKTNYEPLSSSAGTNNQLSGFGYDAAGNMTSNGSASYVYDAENRLVWTSGYRYLYDGDGQRVEKCVAATSTTACPTSGTNGTLYWRNLGSDTLDESDLSGNMLEEYAYFNGQRVARRDVSTNAVHYYFSDHLGSHGVVENATGSVCEQDIDYYPYGGVQNDYCPNVAQHYKFTGKERDSESGLDYFGARHHASSLGRFMTPDWATKPTAVPYANSWNPQSLNLYSYVQNNPIRLGDQNGHVAGVDDLAIGAIVVTAMAVSYLSSLPGQQALRNVVNDITNGVSNIAKKLQPYDVGPHDDLKSKSKAGDGLDIHHVPQAHPAEQTIPGYDRSKAPSIALPEDEHHNIPTDKGTATRTPQEQVDKDVNDLGEYTKAPPDAVDQLTDLIKQTFPDIFGDGDLRDELHQDCQNAAGSCDPLEPQPQDNPTPEKD